MENIVEISGDEEAGFRVRLDPPDPLHTPERFDTYKDARGYAGGLRFTLSRELVDRCARAA